MHRKVVGRWARWVRIPARLLPLGGLALVTACGGSTTTGGTATPGATATPTPCAVTSPTAGPSASPRTNACNGSAAGGTPPSTTKTTFTATGTYKTQPLSGSVTSVTVMCTPTESGTTAGVLVQWEGFIKDTASGKSMTMSGDFQFPAFGGFSFPNTDPKTPTASLLVNSDESNLYGLSGGSFGMGTGSLTATATGGSVSATFLNTPDKMTLSGSWECP